MNKKLRKMGFTLIELLVVIILIVYNCMEIQTLG